MPASLQPPLLSLCYKERPVFEFVLGAYSGRLAYSSGIVRNPDLQHLVTRAWAECFCQMTVPGCVLRTNPPPLFAASLPIEWGQIFHVSSNMALPLDAVMRRVGAKVDRQFLRCEGVFNVRT